MIYCMKCGSKLPDDAKFCKHCGSSTLSIEDTVDNSVENHSAPEVEVETKSSHIVEEKTQSLPQTEVEEVVVHRPQVEVEITTSPKVEVKIKSSPNVDVEARFAPSMINDLMYMPRTEMEAKYVSKAEVETNYVSKAEVERRYTPKAEPAVEAQVIAEPRPTPIHIPEPTVPPVIHPVTEPFVQEEVAPIYPLDVASRYPHVTNDSFQQEEPQAHQANAEVRSRYPKEETNTQTLETETIPNYSRVEMSSKIPPRVEKEELTGNGRFGKQSSVNSFDKTRPKADGFYIDSDFHSGLARKNSGGVYNSQLDTMEGGKWGFVDTARKDVIPLIYDQASPFKEGYAKVWINGLCGLINKKGDLVTPIEYNDVSFPSDGMTGVCLNGKWGFVDVKGKKSIPFKYSDIKPFEEGLAGVCKNGKWGLIDKNDRIVVSFIYTDPSQFENAEKSSKKNKAIKERIQFNPKGFLYNSTVGMFRAWAALFAEGLFLLVVNRLLPTERSMAYWMILAISIVISFVLFFYIIDAVKGAIVKKKE